jgi:chemotaxis protein methyltransferase CheR
MTLTERDLDELLEAIREVSGYDFTRYERATLHRRLEHFLARAGRGGPAAFANALAADGAMLAGLLEAVTVQVTEMFRDPPFYASFRREVAPFLRTYPSLKLWIAGCATGEEAHSAAILLHEEGLYARSLIYATDVSPRALGRARDGIYPVDRVKQYADNYRQAGGAGSFTSYFTVAHGYAGVQPFLTRNLHFAEHNLAGDEAFGEMNVIFCRNVLIYFSRELQEDALHLLDRSLVRGGFLCLGTKETLRLWSRHHGFEEVGPQSRIFRKRLDRRSHAS